MPDNVLVEPAVAGTAISVRTNSIGATHYPVYDDFKTDIARGEVTGAEPYGSYGSRVAATAETNRIIWPDGIFTLPPATGVQMSIVSTDAADDSAGANIRTIEIHYLDANLAEQYETLTMDGLTPVLTQATDIRFINCMHVHTYGTSPYAAGIITASNGGTTYGIIAADAVRCSSSARMVPAGKNCFVAGAAAGSVSINADAGAFIRIVATELDANQYADPLIFFPHGEIGIQNGSVTYNFPVPLRFSAGTVIALMHTVDKACSVSGSWFGWLEDA